MTRCRNSQQNKTKKRQPTEFAVPADHWVKFKESEKREKYLDLGRELKETMEQESDGDICCNYQSIGKGRRFRIQRTSRDHPDSSILKLGDNTEKNPKETWGDSRLLGVQWKTTNLNKEGVK